jgi:hypothetical protein
MKGLPVGFLLFSGPLLLAQNEIGPEGHKLLWLIVLIVPFVGFVGVSLFKEIKRSTKNIFVKKEKIELSLVKSRMHYPDTVTMIIRNVGDSDVDLDRPLLVFDRFWMKRTFKVKGFQSAQMYPLYLAKGETHRLKIDLNGFYRYDKTLKKYSKMKVVVYNVRGKRLGSKSVYLRNTRIKY